MPAPHSLDLRLKAVAAFDKGERKSDICRFFGISRNTLDLWLKRREKIGSVAPKTDYRRGPQPKINDLDAFRAFAEKYGHLTQKEMAEKWPESISDASRREALRKIEFTRKKKTYRYQERDKELEKAFVAQLKQYVQERLVYIDESGFDNTLDYGYGYCHKSERFIAEKLGHRTERVSVIGGWREGEQIAPMVFEGYANSALVCQWVEDCLVPELIPGQIIILDNASVHPKERIQTLVAKAGCEVIFLPPYSPHLNKIEKFWGRLKKEVSKLIKKTEDLFDAIRIAFCSMS
ncbi:transposase [[Leptolyngbya] sp. PCC 7376]|nr:transposase [[Leptolyngbya] sp. PCC 7376]AFY38838.1 transposase [[Leptolyngbya] sp. PCC 7376]AFY40085.1 transposase [[Leptolyngbya] sp. PCC 7376]AFY40267.1 transposase [[Leptolyngbya] sp. PCC 7376]AFY40430.1 transposase [[Leptolyngbya] sp. PCC 7376]